MTAHSQVSELSAPCRLGTPSAHLLDDAVDDERVLQDVLPGAGVEEDPCGAAQSHTHTAVTPLLPCPSHPGPPAPRPPTPGPGLTGRLPLGALPPRPLPGPRLGHGGGEPGPGPAASTRAAAAAPNQNYESRRAPQRGGPRRRPRGHKDGAAAGQGAVPPGRHTAGVGSTQP